MPEVRNKTELEHNIGTREIIAGIAGIMWALEQLLIYQIYIFIRR